MRVSEWVGESEECVYECELIIPHSLLQLVGSDALNGGGHTFLIPVLHCFTNYC